MNKKLALFISILTLGAFSVGAATGTKITASLMQQPIVSGGVASTKQVISYNNSTYVPLREFASMTGTSVDYKNGKIYVGENNTVEAPVQQSSSKFTFTINGVTTGKTNYEGKSVVVANITMKNNSGESSSPMGSLYSITAYQNGVELESTFDSSLSENDTYTNVMNGASLEFGKAFVIKDNSPVTIEIKEFLGKNKVSKTFNL